MYCVFFFKQKTAYEMRISDWSSDVCSSDLVRAGCRLPWRRVRRPVPVSIINPAKASRAAGVGMPAVDTRASVESLGNLERRMTFRLPAERLEDQVGGRLREIARTARIKGFRPGKVPAKRSEEHTSELQSLMRISSA